MQQDKQYVPTVKVLFMGDDETFNDFVQLYVEQVLQIQPNLASNGEFEDNVGIDFDSVPGGNKRQSTRRNFSLAQSGAPPAKTSSVNFDFRTFILPPSPHSRRDTGFYQSMQEQEQ